MIFRPFRPIQIVSGILLWVSGFAYSQSLSLPDVMPQEVIDQEWRIHSLLKEGNLDNQYLTFIAFDEDGVAWICSSNGLFRYDGYTWKQYTTESGLPSSFVRCVSFARNGLMWVGTDKGAGVFDGVSFESMGSESGLSGQCVRRIREDSQGTIWFCCDPWPKYDDPGGLTSFHNGKWTIYDTRDGLPDNHIIDFFEDSQGRQFVLTRYGLAQRDGERWFCPLQEAQLHIPNNTYWSITESAKYGVLISTNFAFYCLKDDSWSQYNNPFYRSSELCRTHDDEIVIYRDVGGEKHYFLAWDGADFQPISAGYKSPNREISYIQESPDGSIWCIGYDCLIRWEHQGGEWTEYKNLPLPRVIDNRNRIWFMDSSRTILLEEERWIAIDNPHPNIASDRDGNVWGWSAAGITQWKGDEIIQYLQADTHLSHPTRFNQDASGDIYFYEAETNDRNRISIFDGFSWTLRIIPEMQTGAIRDIYPDPQKGVWYLVFFSQENRFQLIRVDQESYEMVEIPAHFFASVYTKTCVNREYIWVFGRFGLYRQERNHTSSWISIKEYQDNYITSSVLSGHDLWFGMSALFGGSCGLIQYINRQFHLYPADLEQQVYTSRDGSIFFAGDECLYRILETTDRKPVPLSFPYSGLVASFVKDASENYWIGLKNSVIRYRSDQLPPDTRIINTVSIVPWSGDLVVHYQGVKRFVPTPSSEIFQYSWQFDDEPWTPYQSSPSNGLSIASLKTGSHTLRVQTRDEGLDIDPTPAVLEFTVLPIPLQGRFWFKPLAGIVGMLIVFLVVKLFLTKNKLAHYAHNLEALVRDRTESLQKREATLNSIFRTAPVGIGTATDRIIGWTNEKIASMVGYTCDELAGQSFRILYPTEEEYQRVGKEAYEEISRWGIDSLETRFRRKDGKIIDVLLNLTSIDPLNPSQDITFTALDITEQKQAAQNLRESERIYRETIEVAGAVPYYQNYHTQTYEFVGPSIQEMLGYAPEEFSPQLWTSLVQEFELLGNLKHLSLEEAIKKARGEEGVSWRADYRIRTRTGEERWIANSAVQVRDESNKVIGSLGVLQDITERKLLEEQLRQAQKMEAVGQLAGGVAHNINNLLTGIIGNQTLAMMKATEDIRVYLNNANHAASRAADLVKELLAFSRKSSLELKPLDVNHEVQTIHRFLRETFDRRIDIVARTPAHLPPVLADATQFHTVLMNICLNARDAIEKVMQDPAFQNRQGDAFQITLETRLERIEETDTQIHPVAYFGDFVIISITDNGTGIDEEIQKHIFEPFFTTKDTVGTGLGLASSFGIIKQHNGWIEFDSQYGFETTFRIYLPAAPSQIIPEPPEKVEEVSLTGHETILLADDEDLIVNLGEEILLQKGYKVLKANDGIECLNVIREHKERIDLLVLDLSMPRLSGNEVLQQLRVLAPSLKVIVSSGLSDGFEAESLQSQGAAGVISKPYRPQEFLRKIREILDTTK